MHPLVMGRPQSHVFQINPLVPELNDQWELQQSRIQMDLHEEDHKM